MMECQPEFVVDGPGVRVNWFKDTKQMAYCWKSKVDVCNAKQPMRSTRSSSCGLPIALMAIVFATLRSQK